MQIERTVQTNGSVLTQVRQLIPTRVCSVGEARRIVESQAELLRALLDVSTPHFPSAAIQTIPQTSFSRDKDLPASGCAHWYDGYWHIIVNAAESCRRQRFTAAHELFHIIAHPHLPSFSFLTKHHAHRDLERLADYFAGNLLIPRDHLVRLWAGGVQWLPDLARIFAASEHAVALRLKQVGLIENYWRCVSTSRLKGRPVHQADVQPEKAVA